MTEVEGADPSAVLSAFLPQYYAEASYVPPTIALPEPVEMAEAVERWLSEKSGRRVTLQVARRGRKAELVELACRNARTTLEQRAAQMVRRTRRKPGALRP
ncbi:MAG: hypothetical protein KatS3mg115_2397 [Candidatus Poribacteria bacterium]|nr:MAG: hypothetical protein KatS3mg115_2397 [Candidatus Poribacteria bacterium]